MPPLLRIDNEPALITMLPALPVVLVAWVTEAIPVAGMPTCNGGPADPSMISRLETATDMSPPAPLPAARLSSLVPVVRLSWPVDIESGADLGSAEVDDRVDRPDLPRRYEAEMTTGEDQRRVRTQGSDAA